MEDLGFTIKEVAALTGFSVHTLRYYERVDLLDRVDRSRSGHRRYSKQDIAWIEFLSRLRTTGMPIRKMKQFADLRRVGDATVPARRALLEEHRIETRRRVTELENDLAVIDEKVELYARMEAGNDASTRSTGTDALRPGVG